jgi:hypothetical protein
MLTVVCFLQSEQFSFAFSNSFDAQAATQNEERLLQTIQNISNYVLQERMRSRENTQNVQTKEPSTCVINPSLQQTLSWDTSMLPKQHSSTTTSTTTGGILATKDEFSAGIFVSYIYSSKNKRNAYPSRQEDYSLSVSPTVSYSPTKSLYISITPAIGVRNIKESYLATQDVDESYFTGKLISGNNRTYTALDTSLTPEVGYTFELNDLFSITPSLSAPFSWTKDNGIYRDYTYANSIVPSLRSSFNFNKFLSINAGGYYQYTYNRTKCDNLDDDLKPIGRDTWAFNAGFQLNPTDRFSLSLSAEHTISDRWWSNSITAYASYTF